MLENLKNDFENICVGIDDVLDDTVLWPFWYFVKGHIIACFFIYWFIVISAWITKKQWNLVERDH